jgi:hypothetical protein
MIRNQDLDAAVAAGLIGRREADALAAFAASRRSSWAGAASADERFRFLHGFNDIFLAIGVALVAAALALSMNDGLAVLAFIAPLVMWGLSEIFARRLRAVLPSAAAATGFVLFSGWFGGLMVSTWGGLLSTLPDEPIAAKPADVAVTAGALTALIAAGLYYLRFRLPFAWLLMAAALAACLVSLAGVVAGEQSPVLGDVVWLAVGLGAFALAMQFDLSDPARLTRRSDCGFWLHLVAAPLIVHPLAGPVVRQSDGLVAHNPLILLAVVAVLGLIAIIVDRRALLVSSLLYLSVALAYLMSATRFSETLQIGLVLSLVGSFVLALGLGWSTIRRTILRPIAHWPLIRKLAPHTP